jgi:cell division protein FtsW
MKNNTQPSATNTQPWGSSVDWGLVSVVAAMLVFGLVMVFSASYPWSVLGDDHPYYFILRQLTWLAIGVTGMVVMARIPYTFLERWSVLMMGLALAALVILMFVGSERFGSTRTFFGGSVQPSEPFKIIIIIYIATWLASKGNRIRNVRAGLVPFSILLGFITLLMVLQPSISTAILIVVTASIMFFIAGATLRQLLVVAVGAAATFLVIIRYFTYAGSRLERYMESIWNPMLSQEHQVSQSVQALSRGGPVGVGVGQGLAQHVGFVPLSWTDNIYAVVGEELGLLGALLVILLFALLAYRGLRIALTCRDPFGMLLATGLTAMLVMQALLNVAVVVAVVPPTGVTLPFFSYGGSSLVTALAAVGILLSVSRNRKNSRAATSGASGGRSTGGAGQATNASYHFGWGNRRSRLSGSGSRSTARTGGRPTSAPTSRYASSRRASRRP